MSEYLAGATLSSVCLWQCGQYIDAFILLLLAERQGSGDPTPCGGYPATPCWMTYPGDIEELSMLKM